VIRPSHTPAADRLRSRPHRRIRPACRRSGPKRIRTMCSAPATATGPASSR